IYTHCSPAYENGRHMTILDIGCGRGGDIMKFYYVLSDLVVGIDRDESGIQSPLDGAYSRYNQLKKRHANFPNMYFINADSGVILEPELQKKALGGTSDQNYALLDKFFNPKKHFMFDRMNCQFMIHYMFENEQIFSNFTQNIKTFLKPGGSIMITTFDADRVKELLKDK